MTKPASRWRKIAIAGTVALLFPTACDRTPPAQPPAATSHSLGKRPHVILISLCSVRADHLGCYGYPRATSPNIDALARGATLFEHAVTPWPKTAPSFCAVMTGLYPHQTGVMRTTPNQRLRDDVDTLAERFKRAGYRTAAFISTPALNMGLNLTQGFDVYQETFRQARPWRVTVDHGLAWLKNRKDKPSLLWVHFNNAHYKYQPDEKFKDMFVDDAHYDASRTLPLHRKDMPIPLPPDHPARGPVVRPDLGGVHSLAMLPERPAQRDFYIARYDAAIRSADEYVGEVVKGVRDAMGSEDYIIALWSDHGESLGEHNYYFEHGRFAYETCSRVPLIVRWCSDTRPPFAADEVAPATQPNPTERVGNPVSTIDLAATLCSMAGIVSEGLAGIPWEYRGNSRPRDVFFNGGYHPDFITGIRRGNMKLVSIPNAIDQQMMRNRAVELYDVAADPMETRDLSQERPEVVRELTAALETWKAPWWARAVGQTANAPTKYDPNVRKQLQALGYLSGGDDDAPSSQPASATAPVDD